MEFDTSSITSTPTTATLNIKGFGSSTTTNPPIIVLKGTQTSYNGFTFNDFPGHGAGWDGTDAAVIEYSAEHNSAWSTSAYNTITLNSTSMTDIADDDELQVVIMTYDYDYHDVDPATVGVAEDVCVGVVLNAVGTAQDPYIEFEFGYGNSVMGVDSTSIAKVNGIETGNIEKVIGV